MKKNKRRATIVDILGFATIITICLHLFITAIDNMPPSQAELRGEVTAGPINPAYKVTK
jgi:hypothetical protein